MKLLITLLTVFILMSCKTEQHEKYTKAICGEWTFARVGTDNDIRKENKIVGNKQIEAPPPISENINFRKGYIFYNNNSCEDKRGYFKLADGKTYYERILLFLGTDTKYKVEDDSLKILNLLTNTWDGIKIRSITPDTLTLEVEDSIYFKYSKAGYKLNQKLNFDMILVSSSECNGICPISSTSIDKEGNVIFYGQNYNTKKGLFKSKVDKSIYDRLEQNFKKADIDKLDEDYSARSIDVQTVTVTFIKDNKIYKTISDYGRIAPRELYWAYTAFSFLYQKLDLKPFEMNGHDGFPNSYTCFENKGETCCLLKSESFYLFTELCRSKEVHIDFDKKYFIDYWNTTDATAKILTDGRYYQLLQKGKVVTFDLGYNFLTKNNLYARFKMKKV